MAKQRTTLSFTKGLREEAAEYNVNMSQAAEEGITKAVRKAKIEAWKRENKDFIDSYNKWVDENGLVLSEFRNI